MASWDLSMKGHEVVEICENQLLQIIGVDINQYFVMIRFFKNYETTGDEITQAI